MCLSESYFQILYLTTLPSRVVPLLSNGDAFRDPQQTLKILDSSVYTLFFFSSLPPIIASLYQHSSALLCHMPCCLLFITTLALLGHY